MFKKINEKGNNKNKMDYNNFQMFKLNMYPSKINKFKLHNYSRFMEATTFARLDNIIK